MNAAQLLCITCLLLVLPIRADITLAWDDPNPTGTVTHYILYVRQENKRYDPYTALIITNTPHTLAVTLTNLIPGQRYRAMIGAANQDMTSMLSNEVRFTNGLAAPKLGVRE